MNAQYNAGEALALAQSEDVITGAASQHVIVDSTYRLASAFARSRRELLSDIKASLKAQAALDAKELLTCTTVSQNDTILDCPISDSRNADRGEFLVAVHNQQATRYDQFVRILLPSNNFRAHVWSNQIGSFVDIESDVLEQKHWQKNGQQFVDYEMFLKTFIEPDEVLIVRVMRNNSDEKSGPDDKDEKESLDRVHSLQI
jgi:hypothetical protein